MGNPRFSIDTKAKEHLETLYRKGRARSIPPFQSFDHDYPSWLDGVVVLHWIDDRVANRAHINIGLTHGMTEFACDSFRRYWNRIVSTSTTIDLTTTVDAIHREYKTR